MSLQNQLAFVMSSLATQRLIGFYSSQNLQPSLDTPAAISWKVLLHMQLDKLVRYAWGLFPGIEIFIKANIRQFDKQSPYVSAFAFNPLQECKLLRQWQADDDDYTKMLPRIF
jgi:hypothetical protein